MSDSVLQLSIAADRSLARQCFARSVPTAAGGPARARPRPARFGLCGLLQALATIWCIAATPLPHAHAQQGSQAAPAIEPALDAFLAARRWLDADALPAVDAEDGRVPLAATEAVSVILRLDGRVVGTGDDAVADPGMLRRAVGRAVSRALGDETIRAVRAAANDRVTHRLSLEVELAGPLRPLIGRTIAEAARRVDPGVDGLAVRRGDRVERAFPGRLLASDNADAPERTIAALISDAGLPAQDLPSFRAEDRVSLARFATVRLVQASPQAPPEETSRSGAPIARSEITGGSTRLFASQLCARLASHVVAADERAPEGDVRLLGTMNPTADAFDPPFAGAPDAALAAWVLARASRSDAVLAPIRAKAAQQAARLAASIARERLAGEGAAPDVADALLVLAWCDLGADAATRDALVARAATLLGGESGDPESVAFAALAVDAARRAGTATTAADSIERAIVAQLERHASSRGRLVDALVPLALLASSDALSAATRDRLRSTLSETAEVLRGFQIDLRAADAPPRPADLDGGLDLPGRGADARCLKIGAGIAIATAAAGSDDTAVRESIRGLLRFLAQHVADSPWVDTFRSPSAARGLVRASLWTDDLPPAATTAGLLLAMEGASVLDRPAAQGAPKASP